MIIILIEEMSNVFENPLKSQKFHVIVSLYQRYSNIHVFEKGPEVESSV